MNQTAQVLESARFYIYSMLKKKTKKNLQYLQSTFLLLRINRYFKHFKWETFEFRLWTFSCSPITIPIWWGWFINNNKLASLLMKVNTFFATMYNHFPFLKHAINSKLRCCTFTYQVELCFPCSNLQQIWVIFFHKIKHF